MSDDNRYVRAGEAKMLASGVIEETDGDRNWDFEKETWGIQHLEATEHWAHTAGVEAAGDDWGEFDTCYTCKLEFTQPKISIDEPWKLSEIFPAKLVRPSWTTWFLGFENFKFNRDTGCREVDVYVMSTRGVPHLTDIPNSPVQLRYRYFILTEVPVPDWIKETM
jgi:hypothetical protein